MTKVSVIMGVFNCATTLAEAIDSLLAQTYSDWHLVMCEDGSTDDTYVIAQEYQKKYPDKITLLRHNENYGLNITLNDCLAVAKGEYIARMDGDDISLPNRFEEEVRFLDLHPEYSIVSTPMIYFDEDGDFRKSKGKGEPDKRGLAFGTIFCHAPCMVRKEAFDAVGGYAVSNRRLRVEDWDLWIRMYEKGYRGYSLEEPLYKMRDDQNAFKRRTFKYRINEVCVGASAVRKLKLNPLRYILCLRPIAVWLTPKFIYDLYHRKGVSH